MSSTILLPSFRRQQLVLDFSTLRDDCPEGIYLSLTPGNPSIWGGVFFVRKGPYSEAILRFQISFPDTYPTVPPLVTFSTDVFHPLVVPLTTYTFSANADPTAGVSASDEDRLPPGSFSLRYGFPDWFHRNVPASEQGSGLRILEDGGQQAQGQSASEAIPSTQATKENTQETPSNKHQTTFDISDRKAILLNLLRHIHTAFSSETLLDEIPSSAAGNPSAWHAWRAHRGLNIVKSPSTTTSPDLPPSIPSSPKHPGDWKWDGVWESRVDSAVRESISEGALFGNTASGRSTGGTAFGRPTDSPVRGMALDHRQKLQALADRQVKFSKLDDETFAEMKRKIGLLTEQGAV